MKKFFVCMFVVCLMVTGSTLHAQEVEATPEAQVEPIAEAQGSVSDGISVEQTEGALPIAEGALPIAEGQPITSDGIIDSGVVAGGIVTDGQPIQAFNSFSGCDCCCQQTACCEQNSFAQPVVFNQPIISSQPIIPESLISQPIQGTFDSQPITTECSACSGAVADFTPAPVETFAAAPIETFTPLATSFPAPEVTQTFAPAPVQTFAPAQTFVSAPAPAPTFAPAPTVTQTFATARPARTFTPARVPSRTFTSAPVATRACAVQATAPAACNNCSPNNRFRGRMFSRLRRSAVTSVINNDN